MVNFLLLNVKCFIHFLQKVFFCLFNFEKVCHFWRIRIYQWSIGIYQQKRNLQLEMKLGIEFRSILFHKKCIDSLDVLPIFWQYVTNPLSIFHFRDNSYKDLPLNYFTSPFLLLLSALEDSFSERTLLRQPGLLDGPQETLAWWA